MSPKRKAKQLQAQIDDLRAQLDAHAEQIAALIMKAPKPATGRASKAADDSAATE